MDGKTIEGQQPVRVQTSIHMYEAEISAQAILSYKWLADQNFLVHPRRHGLYFQDENVEVFIPGISEEGSRTQVARLDKVVAIRLQSVPMGLLDSKSPEPTQVKSNSKRAKGKERRTSTSPTPAQIESDDSGDSSDPIRGRSKVPDQASSSSALRQKTPSPSRSRSPKTDTPPLDSPSKILRMLDLFSGTGSTASVFRKKGYEVVTLDNNPKFQPDILTNILDWDYKNVYPEGHFDVIAASPPVRNTALQ